MRRLVVRLLVPAAVAITIGAGAYAYFSSSGTGTGSVLVGTLDAPVVTPPGAPSFNSADMAPGESESQPMTVKVTGALDTSLALYLQNLSGSLPTQLQLTIVEDGSTTVYSGSVSAFPTSAAPLTLPGSLAGNLWASGEQHSFDFTVSLPIGTGNGSQGATGTFNFVWLREQT